MHYLVVGCGSIGLRHMKNLIELGVQNISVVDPDRGKLRDARMITMHLFEYTNLEAALKANTYDGAIVAVPTHKHSEVAVPIIEAHIPVLIEKPLT